MKQDRVEMLEKMYSVTPFVGVWIETAHRNKLVSQLPSHPSWVCGLKQVLNHLNRLMFRHTLRGCVD